MADSTFIIIRPWSFVLGCWLFVLGLWSFVLGLWLFVLGFWSFVLGCWLLVVGCWQNPLIGNFLPLLPTLGRGKERPYTPTAP